MLNSFPLFRQRDAMDCGPTCLMMIARYYGKSYSLPFLREKCYLNRDGVSALGITEGAEYLGFRAMTVKIPYKSGTDGVCLLEAPMPCIAHWNQKHFIIIYKISHKYVWIADPGAGKFKLNREDFEKNWVSDIDKGVIILIEPTPEFYKKGEAHTVSVNNLSHIFSYLKPFSGLIRQLIIGMFLGSVFQLILPFLTQSIVDIGIENQNINFIYLILLGQIMLFLSQLLVHFFQNRILLHIGTRINVALVTDFLIKLMRLPIAYFDTKMTGDLMQRIGDQTRIESFLTQSSLSVIFSAINFFVFSILLLFYNVQIFYVFITIAFCYISWIAFFLRKRREIDYVRFQQASDNQNSLIELIQGMQEIKLQGSGRKRRSIWAGIQAKLFNTSLKSLNLAQWQEAGAAFFNQSKDIIITIIAASAVIEGKMTLGMMMATQYIVGQLNAPLQQFIAFIRAAQDAKISMERLAEIHQQPDEEAFMDRSVGIEDLGILRGGGYAISSNIRTEIQALSIPKTNITHNIYIQNLVFKYNELDIPVLKNINITIPQGKVTAIVGTSGSGKTTLVKILLGMYKPSTGSIRLGNMNIQNITPSIWRKHCGAVMQDGFIFSDTIANNIAESATVIEKTQLLKAVQTANIQEYIESLPLGYNTIIGARGNGVSQGQRQRILIARAVYKNPDFLFFDEATNALDANNERVIVENLQDFFENRTVIVVAHRLSTVKNADQIVVLEKGEVVEVGKHSELVAIKGAYYNLVKNQLELGQ
jgi:ATP-binding cassette, subfamily B, bacterial